MVKCTNCFENFDGTHDVCPFCGYYEGKGPQEAYQLSPGVIIGERYKIGMVIGVGGFGITYKAWDMKLDALVAIKEYYPAGIVNRTPGNQEVIIFSGKRKNDFEFGRVRFLDEAKNMAKFTSSRNIVHVFDYFEENNTAYIVMEYLDGVALNVFLRENGEKMDLATGIRIASSICDALRDIHKSGIVHRDISPDNIFICVNNNIKLIDFGAARFSLDEDKKMTIILKPGFAPPEQYDSINEQGPWTDVYALGATLYLILTGIKPSESTNRKVSDDVKYPHEIEPSIPVNISNAIMKAMALDRHMRFNNVDDFINALNGNKKVIPVEEEKKKKKKIRITGILVATFAVILSGVLALGYWSAQKEEKALPDAEILVWIEESSNGEAFNQIIQNFESTYNNVNVNLEVIPDSEYEQRIAEAIQKGEMPDLFESTDLSESSVDTCVDVSTVLSKVNADLLLSDLNSEYKKIPIGFNVCVAYVNISKVRIENNVIKSDASLVTSAGLINKVDYSDFIKTNNITPDFKNVDEFYNGKTDVLLATTNNFHKIQEMLPGRYSVLKVPNEDGKISGYYTMYFSVFSNDENKQKVAERLLWYLYGDVSQDIIFIQNGSKGLPVNKTELDTYVKTFSDFNSVISTDIKDYDIKEK